MKKATSNIVLFVVLIILVLAYILIRCKDAVKQDYYELNSGFYLEKIDYFSQYAVVKKSGSGYLPIISDVRAISSIKDGYLIKFKDKSVMKYLFLASGLDEPVISEKITDFDKLISLQKIVWKKPWQVIEIKTLSNQNKLISQLLVILIVLTVLFIIIKIFKIRRIT